MPGENLAGEGEEKSSVSKQAMFAGAVTAGVGVIIIVFVPPLTPLGGVFLVAGTVAFAGGAGYEIRKKFKEKSKKEKKPEEIKNLDTQTANLQTVFKRHSQAVQVIFGNRSSMELDNSPIAGSTITAEARRSGKMLTQQFKSDNVKLDPRDNNNDGTYVPSSQPTM